MSTMSPLAFHRMSHSSCKTDGSSGLAPTIHWNSSSTRRSFPGPFHLSVTATSASFHPLIET